MVMKRSPAKVTKQTQARRGRPLDEEKNDYKQNILDSAENCFASQGFDSVSLKDIAQPVGVTPAMIHYYFGSKKVLLAAVLESAFQPLASAIAAMSHKDDPDVENFVSLIFEVMRAHPNLPLLLMRQVLLPGSPMQSHFLEQLAPRLGGALPGIIKKSQASGRIAPDLNPSFAALMILSLCIFPFISKPLSQPALELGFDGEGMEELQRHITRFVHGGLQAT